MNHSDPNPNQELIIFTDESGHPTGQTGFKLDSHHASTQVHLAFSVYLFNEQGNFLVTQRAHTKKVWPGVRTNTCCGHPLPGEQIEQAIARRLDYELGTSVAKLTTLIANYRYTTPPYQGIVENEFCPIFAGRIADPLRLNPNEVAAYRWMSWPAYLTATAADSSDYAHPDGPNAPVWSYWCKDQLRLIADHPSIQRFTQV